MENTTNTVITTETFDIELGMDLDHAFWSNLNTLETFASSFEQEMARDGIDQDTLAKRKAMIKHEKIKGTEEEKSLQAVESGQNMWINDTMFRKYISIECYVDLMVLTFLDTVNASKKLEDGSYVRVYDITDDARKLRNKLTPMKGSLLAKYVKAYQTTLEA